MSYAVSCNLDFGGGVSYFSVLDISSKLVDESRDLIRLVFLFCFVFVVLFLVLKARLLPEWWCVLHQEAHNVWLSLSVSQQPLVFTAWLTNLLRFAKRWYSHCIIPFSVISYSISLKRSFPTSIILLPSYMKGSIYSLFLLVEIWLLVMLNAVLLGWSLLLSSKNRCRMTRHELQELKNKNPSSYRDFLFNWDQRVSTQSLLFYIYIHILLPCQESRFPRQRGKQN